MAPMSDSAAPARSIIEWGWAGSALEGESGDLHVIVPFANGALIALLDGLGHGPEAAAAARAAVPILEQHATDPVLTLVQRCHEGLKKTRGAVMSLASFDARASAMTWAGVGNVEGVLLRAQPRAESRNEAILVRGGVVGYRLPPLHVDAHFVSRGDIVILATDGIRSGFIDSLEIDHEPQVIAESILARFAKGTDDAHVLVVRYRGGGT
jgi:negative regulator of sigma-B (phosphoserine phosphatase)